MIDRDEAAPGAAEPPPAAGPVVTGVPGLQAIIDALRGQGFTVIGPTRPDGSIVLAEIAGVGDLPAGCDPCISCATHFLDLTVERR
jgi:hypothetical protein